MKIPGGQQIPAKPHRRNSRNSSIPGALRRRQEQQPSPLFHFKLRQKQYPDVGFASPVRIPAGLRNTKASARKLASGLWQSRYTEVSGCGFDALACGSFHRSEPKETYPLFESFRPFLKIPFEGAAKWNMGHSEPFIEFSKIQSYKKHLGDDGQSISGSVISALLAELLHARLCMSKLKAVQKSSKREAEHFVQKLQEERIYGECREIRKSQAVVRDLKGKLRREKKTREKMEILNTTLVNEIVDLKVSAKQLMQMFEEERRGRELMEEICNELAKQTVEDKAEIEALKRESVEICAEVEEERKMFQMAALWREERIQMKLFDAKVALEDKYDQMNQLMTNLRNLLMSGINEIHMVDLKKAELIQRAAESVNIRDIEELSYIPSKPDDIFSLFDDLRKREVNEMEMETCVHPSPVSYTSRIHILSPDDGLSSNHGRNQSVESIDYEIALEDNKRTVRHEEDRGLIFSHEGSDPFVNRFHQAKNVSGTVIEGSKNFDPESPNRGVGTVFSRTRQPKQKASPAPQLGLFPVNGKISSAGKTSCQEGSDEDGLRCMESPAPKSSGGCTFSKGNKRPTSEKISGFGTTSAYRSLGKDGSVRPDSAAEQSSPYCANLRKTRGINGSIECSYNNIPKSISKTESLEARVGIQKSQFAALS